MQQVTREDVFELIQRLPDDKLVTLYDFGRYILQLDELPDFLRATPSELAAEEAAWDFEINQEFAAIAVTSGKP